jgi:hypothetical protein
VAFVTDPLKLKLIPVQRLIYLHQDRYTKKMVMRRLAYAVMMMFALPGTPASQAGTQ